MTNEVTPSSVYSFWGALLAPLRRSMKYRKRTPDVF